MVKLVAFGVAKLFGKLRGEDAQDAFEYLLIVGGVGVAVVAAVVLATPGLIDPVIDGTCNAISAIPGFAGMECAAPAE
ncbi:MAG: hypothetical protein FJ320_11275 [SAR202 cluster bacterium]|nr:hypothetical protein [SAR202 cluster bacterium]